MGLFVAAISIALLSTLTAFIQWRDKEKSDKLAEDRQRELIRTQGELKQEQGELKKKQGTLEKKQDELNELQKKLVQKTEEAQKLTEELRLYAVGGNIEPILEVYEMQKIITFSILNKDDKFTIQDIVLKVFNRDDAPWSKMSRQELFETPRLPMWDGETKHLGNLPPKSKKIGYQWAFVSKHDVAYFDYTLSWRQSIIQGTVTVTREKNKIDILIQPNEHTEKLKHL